MADHSEQLSLDAWPRLELEQRLAGGARNAVFLARRGVRRFVVRRSTRTPAALAWELELLVVSTLGLVGVLPNFEVGETIVMSERWRGLLWSAVPQRCVASTRKELVTYVARGAMAVYASNRDLPATRDLPRSERKLEAMRTCVYEVIERPLEHSSLCFFNPDSWAAVYLGWNDDGSFWGWYVNFQQPVRSADDALESKDLVLDLLIAPDGSATWKDRQDFDLAVARGILDEHLEPRLRAAADAVLATYRRREGSFDPTWQSWQPDPTWPVPELPASYRVGGHHWSSPRPTNLAR